MTASEDSRAEPWRGLPWFAIASTLGLAAVSAWMVKILGPRAVNPDYFCNSSVLEGMTAMTLWPIFSVGCVVLALSLRRARGISRAVGILAGLSSFALPALAIVAISVVPFPTIEELHGWAIAA
ncbi:hypothetical protein [Schumannella luteola]|jgi:hypothetical protein